MSWSITVCNKKKRSEIVKVTKLELQQRISKSKTDRSARHENITGGKKKTPKQTTSKNAPDRFISDLRCV